VRVSTDGTSLQGPRPAIVRRSGHDRADPAENGTRVENHRRLKRTPFRVKNAVSARRLPGADADTDAVAA